MRLLLIPGAGGDPWYWHRVVPLLALRGHSVVVVDLPAADPAAGLPQYVDAAVAAAAGLPVDGSPLVVVGQSLAGFSAPTAAQRLGAGAVVLVNAMVPAAGEPAGAWWTTTGQPAAQLAADVAAGRTPGPPPGDPGFDEATYFLHDVPEEVLSTSAGPRPQTGTVFGSPFPGWPELPVRLIAGADDRFFPPEFQRRVAAERLGRGVRLVPGGHLVALARPADLVEALLEEASAALAEGTVSS